MARLLVPSRLELKRPEGSFREAPLAKVIFTTFLYVSPVQTIPSCDQTGTLLDHPGVGLLDEGADPREQVAPPVAQFLDLHHAERLLDMRRALRHLVAYGSTNK